jgi:hypothetical protein
LQKRIERVPDDEAGDGSPATVRIGAMFCAAFGFQPHDVALPEHPVDCF